MHSSLVFLLLFKLLIFFLWFSSFIYPLYGNGPQGFIPARILFLFWIISTVAPHPVTYAGGSHSLILRLTSPGFQIFFSHWLLVAPSWISHRNHMLSIAKSKLLLPIFLVFINDIMSPKPNIFGNYLEFFLPHFSHSTPKIRSNIKRWSGT